MTLHIPLTNALIFVLGYVVFHVVYARAKRAHPRRSPEPEHLAAAIASGAAVIASLAVLFGVGDESGTAPPAGEPPAGVSSSATPPP